MSSNIKLPWWLKPANRVIMALNRIGLAIGTQHILSIPGRKTGKPRSTPVSLLTVDGQRYIVTAGETGWVKNARAAGWGTISRGRKRERVALVELPVAERAAILREFPRQVPHGVQFFELVLGLPNDPEAFAAAAPRCPVFRLHSSPPASPRDHAPAAAGQNGGD
jgi:deazaflavin-dependent oxidoreductase (nitroreductase family)